MATPQPASMTQSRNPVAAQCVLNVLTGFNKKTHSIGISQVLENIHKYFMSFETKPNKVAQIGLFPWAEATGNLLCALNLGPHDMW